MSPNLLLRYVPLCLMLILLADVSGAVELGSFRTGNMSPVSRIFGIPLPGSARILDRHSGEIEALLDVANNYTGSSLDKSNIILDSEIWQMTLGLRHGVTANTEVSIQIPFLYQGGGVLDSFFESWHSLFGLPQGGRDMAPRNRLLYRYRDNYDVDRINVTDAGSGIGDLRLGCGYRLFQSNDGSSSTALRALLKLPTGSSGALRGSGSTDLSLWITGARSFDLPYGPISVFASGGGTVLTDGKVLPDMQRNLAAFGTLGGGWSPWESIGFKLQVNAHSALYRSRFRQLGQPAVQLLLGGTVALAPSTSLDIGVSEDISTNTSSDAAFHLGLVTRY